MSQQFHPAPPPGPSYGPPPTTPPPRRSRTAFWVVVVLLLALVAGGAIAFVALRDSDDSSTASGKDPEKGPDEGTEGTDGEGTEGEGEEVLHDDYVEHVVTPLTEQPTPEWKWFRPGAKNLDIMGRADILVVSFEGEDRGLVRLDDEGREMWHRPGENILMHVDERRRRIFVGMDAPTGFIILDADTGEELWRNEDLVIHDQLTDSGNILAVRHEDDPHSPGGVVLGLDGEVLWETQGRIEELEGDVLRNRGSRLTRLDGDTGEEMWEEELPIRPYDDSGVGVLGTATGMAVVLGKDALVGVDSEFGTVLWRKPHAEHFRWVEPFSPRMVAVSRPIRNGRNARALLVTREGIVARPHYVQRAEFDSFYGYTIRTEGDVYVYAYLDGLVYSEEGEVVADLGTSTRVREAGTGYYTFIGSHFAYNTLDEREVWSVSPWTPGGVTNLVPGDGSVAVVEGNIVRSYE